MLASYVLLTTVAVHRQISSHQRFQRISTKINPAAQAETQDLYPGMSLAARNEFCVWCRYGGGQLSLISIRLHYWIWDESESNARPTYLCVT
jgi:hypothetical protein